MFDKPRQIDKPFEAEDHKRWQDVDRFLDNRVLRGLLMITSVHGPKDNHMNILKQRHLSSSYAAPSADVEVEAGEDEQIGKKYSGV